MGESPERQEPRATIPEYDFEEGVEKIDAKIKQLLTKQDVVVVAFGTYGTNVGKTTLAKTLVEKLTKDKIPAVTSVDDPDELVPGGGWKTPLEHVQKFFESNKAVIIFQQLEMGLGYNPDFIPTAKQAQNDRTVDAFKKMGYTIKGIDLWVTIYRPDRPLAEKIKSWGDIIVRNDEARNK